MGKVTNKHCIRFWHVAALIGRFGKGGEGLGKSGEGLVAQVRDENDCVVCIVVGDHSHAARRQP